jgi:anion-transporting  ArsA/GET3 family ATPase
VSAQRASATPHLHLFTGKGGVGKTTLVAALALASAAQGRRPVVVELGHRSSLAGVLGLAPGAIGHAPTEVVRGVWASNVSLEHALADYLARRVRSRALGSRIAASRGLATFFEAAPAVPELLALEHVAELMARFDIVLVDLDATGHALMFLELPALLSDVAPAGPIGELVRGLGAILGDAARTRVHLVTLPLALSVEETLELEAELSRRRVPLGTIVVNQRAERPLAPGEEAEARALLEGELAASDREALVLALEGTQRWEREGRALEALARTPHPRVILPQLDHATLDHGAGALSHASLARLGALAAQVLA